MRRSAFRIGLYVFLIFFVAHAGQAQTTGDIEGRLTDTAGGALAGVTVSAVSPSLQGTRVGVSDRNGAFRMPAVPPGQYSIRTNLDGFRPVEKTATVPLDGTASVDFVLEPLVKEAVVVSGQAPLLDPTSTTTGTNYTSTVVSSLPVARNYADIVRANPGVSTDRGDTQGRSLALTIYGATSGENQWIIDGVNTTNVFQGTQGKAINNEFVQEVEVKTGGYQAEYGRALGGVINVITKSGGNEFHGDAFLYYDSTDTAARRRFEPGDSGIAEMRISDGRRLDYGIDIGGFILKDRLWFFGAYNRVDLEGDVSRVQSSAHVSSSDRFPFNEAEDLYSGKLTWNAAPSTSVVGTVFADPSNNAGAAGADPRQGLGIVHVTPIVSLERSTWFSARKQGGTDYGVRATRLFGSNAIATLQGSYHRDRNNLTAPDGIRYSDYTCPGGTPDQPCDDPPEANFITGGYGRVNGFQDYNNSTRRQYRGDITLYRGNHEVKTGGDYEDGRTNITDFFTGGQLVFAFSNFGQPYYGHRFFAVSPDDTTIVPAIKSRGEVLEYGVYVQDSWRAARGVTVNLGLRWDGEETRNGLGGSVLRLRNQWQPRVGVVWDPWGDGATKISAFAGRFSFVLPTGHAAAAFSNVTRLQTWNFDPVNVLPDPDVGYPTFVLATGASGNSVDTGLKAPYQDEMTVGIERLLGGNLTVGLKATYRRLGATIEDRCDFDYTSPETGGNSCAFITPGSSGRFARGDVPTCNGLIDDSDWYRCDPTGPASPPARRLYRGIEVSARKSAGDRLWLQASYIYSSLRGNYDGGVNQVTGSTGLGWEEDYDYPAQWHNGYGTLALDRPHKFRFDGFWVTPWRLSVGLQAFVESGAPLNRLGYFNFFYGSMVFLVPRGSAGRLPTLWDGNLVVGYPVTVGPLTVTLQGYVFNLFNNQIATSRDDVWSRDPPDGFPDTIYDPNQEQNNPEYGKITGRSEPRSFRAAVKISF
jgi:outer membrane receptor protein involved in Fe transport